jgi:predicted lipoprotein with Yx(FWY)xxD motif
MTKKMLVGVALATALAGCASMESTMSGAPVRVSEGVLTNGSGMTLYTFDKDAAGSGKSACSGPCAANWPPLAAGAYASGMGDYSVVTRDDGSKQWAYKGKPLYTWTKDAKPGDRTGDGFNNAWRVARP